MNLIKRRDMLTKNIKRCDKILWCETSGFNLYAFSNLTRQWAGPTTNKKLIAKVKKNLISILILPCLVFCKEDMMYKSCNVMLLIQ